MILGTFAILWGKTFAIGQGMEPAEAIAKGTLVFVTAQASALLWIPLLGFSPRSCQPGQQDLVICMSLATAGYLGNDIRR